MASDKKIIFIPYEDYKDGNRDYYSHSSATFEITSKFLNVFVRLIMRKKGVNGFLGPRGKSDIRYEFHLKILSKGLRCK